MSSSVEHVPSVTHHARPHTPAAAGIGSVELRDALRVIVVAAAILGGVFAAVSRAILRRNPTRIGDAAAAGVADAFERLGPTFVKVGQLITSSPGIFPAPLVAACSRHLYEVGPVPVEGIRRVIADDLAAPVESLFAAFDDTPLSAASIAQVHACTLLDGTAAVVKVQRPDITERMTSDLRILSLLARTVHRIPKLRPANLPGIVDDLHAATMRELDFGREATAQTSFRHNLHVFGDNQQVMVPKVFETHSGPRVICMERLHGTPMDRYAAGAPRAEDGALVLRRIVKAWLEAVLLHGPFHGDVHGGNIWVLDDGRIAFLDFGINGELDPEWRELIVALLAGTALTGDFARLARAAKTVGAIAEDAGSDEDIGRMLSGLAAPFLATGVEEVSFAEVFRNAFTAIETLGAELPPELVLIFKQLFYFEGYTKALAPDLVIPTDLYLVRNVFPDEVANRLRELGTELPA